MSPSKQFKYTLDQPLAPNIPNRMLARKQQAYTDPHIFDHEVTSIFDHDWVMVGRSGAIPHTGDYMTAFLGRRPIIVMRQQDGSIRTMANYCLHRYVKLLEGSGSTKSIVCPYHCWVYKLDGELIGVPEREGFRPDDIDGLALETLATDEYLGYVFVSLRKDLQPVSERLQNLGPILKNFELDRYEDRHVVYEEQWNANWKLIYHNFIESYHVTYTHRKSIGPTNPTNAVEYGPPIGDPNFTIHSNSYTREHQPDIYNPQLEEEEFRRFYVVGVFPNGLIAVDPNFVWWMALEPKSVDQTNARWGLSFSHHAMQAMPEPEKFVKEVINVIETATTEDKQMVERMQTGSNFGSDKAGLLHAPLEVYIKEFDDYVMRLSGS